MKKFVFLLVLMLCLAGCGEEPVMETVADPVVEPVLAEPQAWSVWLPEEAAAQTMADGEAGECYTWGECELRIRTLDGGDIRATLQTLTGLDPEKLTVMEYERDGIQLYQTVWSSTTEEGVLLGRCMVADDGAHHYCISLLSPEDADVGDTYARICASLTLGGEAAEK